MNQATLSILNTIVNYILAGIGTFVVFEIKKYAPTVLKFISSKIDASDQAKLESYGAKVFKAIEEDGRLGKLVNSKIDTFATMLKAKFPIITDDEINLLRQSLANEINKDKQLVAEALKEAEPVVTVAVATPIIKYYAADGVTELQPVASATIDATTTSTEKVVTAEATANPI